jgi:hypothetical protein
VWGITQPISVNDILKPDAVINLHPSASKVTVNAGLLKFTKAYIFERPSFTDYLRSGWQIALSVAIDFTESNRDPDNPDSLHNQDSKKNEYEQALKQVLTVLEPYDSDKMIPTFGFGGIPEFIDCANPARLKDCFPLNGDLNNAEIYGLNKLLEVYRTNFTKIKLAGPTNFAGILREFIKSTQATSFSQQIFNILLILTDGDIHDMRETKSLIVAASELPCAIVIVGLGDAQFNDMEILDSDNVLLRDDFGKVAQRDIVQFVKFREVQHN